MKSIHKKNISLEKNKEHQPDKANSNLELPDNVEIFLLWLENQKNLSPATVRAYKTDLEDFNLFLNNEIEKNLSELKSISKKDVQLYLAKLHKENYSKTSVSRKLSSLRSFFNYSLRKNLIQISPLATIKNPKQAKYHPNVPTCEQVVHILDNKNHDKSAFNHKDLALNARNLALLELLYGSGLRVSEALALNKADFSREKKFLIVLGKGNKQRIVPLTDICIQVLETWLEHYNELSDSLSSDVFSPLFIGARGNRLNRREVLRIIDKVEKTAGTPHLTAHSFRHAYATHLLENGLDLRVVQELLGHAQISTTQVYTHLNLKHLIESYHKAHPESVD